MFLMPMFQNRPIVPTNKKIWSKLLTAAIFYIKNSKKLLTINSQKAIFLDKKGDDDFKAV